MRYHHRSTEIKKHPGFVYRCNHLVYRRAMLFKSEDGRIWLAKVTTAPVLTPGSNLNITSIDFSITEIGESNSTEDLYNSGLLSLIKES